MYKHNYVGMKPSLEPNYESSDSGSGDEEPMPKRMKKEDDENTENGNKNEENIRNRKNEENNFLRLFTLILDIVINTKEVTEERVSDAIVKLKKSFRKKSFEEFDLTEWENICAYLYRLGSHGAGLARYRILRAIRNCKAVETMFKKSDLRIICLGTGPGNDAVGLCSALSEVHFPTNLKLTVVDEYKEWFLCVKLVKLLIEEGNFGKISELFQKTKVDLCFSPVDLPGNSDEEYLQTLRKADVILMSKLITFKDPEFKETLIQSLFDNMKDEALILLIDTCYEKDWRRFERVYGFICREEDYRSTAMARSRFRSCDSVESMLPINVMRKKLS